MWRQQEKLQKAAAFSHVGPVVAAVSLLLHLGQQRCRGQGWALQGANCCQRTGQLAASQRGFSHRGDSLLARAAEAHRPPGTSLDLHVCLLGSLQHV